jgi:hypothetical protein
MIGFFRRRKDEPKPEPASQERVLMDQFHALDPDQRDRVAVQLAELWEWLITEFGGPAGFLDKPQAEQDAYIERLRIVTQRTEEHKETDLGRYYYSSALLSLYASALRAERRDPDQTALAALVASMIDRGRQLSQAAEK